VVHLRRSEAEPHGIDFEGLNAIVRFRQPQIRWSVPVSERSRIAFALEDPKPELTGATGVNQVPDFVVRLGWEPRRGGHVAALLTQLWDRQHRQPRHPAG
jgi:hypothetical protein